MDSAVPMAPSSQSWPATNGARKLAEALGVDLREQPAVKKRRGKAAAPEGPSEAAGRAPAPEISPVEEVCGDPLLLDGNRVRVKCPMEDGTWAELGGAVRWLAERAAAGRKRVYEGLDGARERSDVAAKAGKASGGECKHWGVVGQKCRRRVARVLSASLEFVHMARGNNQTSVYRYDVTRAPSTKSKAKPKTDKSMNYVKAFRK
ncbi:hypothetical protein CYMTET_56787 [Cymbomonas tetramitiformis]|nr:hypothetical protein CYMTET_56787 [Cymbomonas tetramitiformis]